MHRLFKKDKEKKASKQTSEEKTLDDVIRDKDAEKKKLEEEESEFQQKKRERERKIIQIEKEELDRREDEVRKRRSEYDHLKKNDEAIEDKLEGKIKELQMELEDKRLDHRSAEGTIDRDITNRVLVINDLRRSLTRRMDEFGGLESISASPSAPEFPSLDLVDGARENQRAEAYNPFEYAPVESPKKTSMINPFESRTMENLKKSSNNLCKSLENITTTADSNEAGPSTRGRGTAKSRGQRYDRTKSLHRAETEPTALIYPTVPDLDPCEAYPTVPDCDPGEEGDIFMTIKRSPKRKRAQKIPIDTVD